MDQKQTVYPISSDLRKDVEEQIAEYHNGEEIQAIEQMVEAVGEYEHGTADVADLLPELAELLGDREDVDQILLRAVAAVVRDMALTIIHS